MNMEWKFLFIYAFSDSWSVTAQRYNILCNFQNVLLMLVVSISSADRHQNILMFNGDFI
jgi:hypothetical protein